MRIFLFRSAFIGISLLLMLKTNAQPNVTINQAAVQSDPTSGSPINFTAIFNEAVTGFTSSDVSLSGSAGATTVVITEIAPNNGTTYNIAVSGMIADGTVIANMPAGVVVNSSNVGNMASSSADNSVTYDQPTPPTVTINKAASQPSPTTGVPIHFTVFFNQVVTGFDASDISFTGSTVQGTLVATISGAGQLYDVSVSGMTSQGLVIASVVADAAMNETEQSSLASTSVNNVVAFEVVPHDIIVMKQGQLSVVAGNFIAYQMTVINASNSNRFGVTFSDQLPLGTTFNNLIPVGQNVGLLAPPIVTAPPAGTNGLVTVFFPALAPGANVTFIVSVHVDANLTGSITNTATISGPPGDVNPNNNTSTLVTQIAVPPTITCPGNIVLNAESGKCDAQVSFTGENEVIVTGTSVSLSYTINSDNGSFFVGTGLPSNSLPVGVNTVNITAANDAGSSSCSFTVTVVDDQPPVINCPSDVTVNAQPGQCSAMATYSVSGSENCLDTQRPLTIQISTGITFSLSSLQSFPISQSLSFPVGTTRVNVLATDAAGNTATCSFNVTVVDNEKPVINCPSAVTVSCASEIPVPDISAASASDNCGATTITHVGDIITNQTCANKYTLTRTYKATDGSGNTATCSQLITVDDNTPPQITGLTSSKQVLWPANHKMVDVMLNYTVNDNCVSTPNVSINITSNEPVNGTGDADTDPDWEVVDDHHVRLRAERAANGTGRIYTITVTVSDGCNASVSATTQVMVVHNITAPHSGNSFKVGSTVAFSGEFWDKPGSKHTAKWLIDGSTTTGVVTEPSGNKNGKVTGSFKFNTPGVYKLQMNVTDQAGVTSYANTNGDLEAIVVIYDPNGGYTYGGGYYDSRAGALVSNPSTTGKASYGFVMNYFKNSTNPKGETQFEFKVGDFEFNALNFDYLVISNSMAQFKGTGKIIGGQSGVAFTMTVTDGQLDGSGVDKIRMKIYNKNNGKIIYDNQPGASDAALPTQAVGANSLVVISGINSSLTSVNTSQKAEMEARAETSNDLEAIAYPNPSASNFTINVKANSSKGKITMQMVDMYGRVIETRNVSANSITRFGDRYRPGTYFVRIIQGKEHKEIKLVKLTD